MNYISHFYVHGRNNELFFNTGLSLPDLLGSFSRKMRLKCEKHSFSIGNHRKLAEGVMQHYLADKLFHNAAFFEYGTQQIKITLQQAGLHIAGARMFFVNHVLFEMLLDRFLLQENDELGHVFYRNLLEVPKNEINNFMQIQNLADENFLHFLNKFIEYRFLFGYRKSNELFYALNRIIQRTGQTGYSEKIHLPLFTEILPELEKTLKTDALTFLKELKEKV